MLGHVFLGFKIFFTNQYFHTTARKYSYRCSQASMPPRLSNIKIVSQTKFFLVNNVQNTSHLTKSKWEQNTILLGNWPENSSIGTDIELFLWQGRWAMKKHQSKALSQSNSLETWLEFVGCLFVQFKPLAHVASVLGYIISMAFEGYLIMCFCTILNTWSSFLWIGPYSPHADLATHHF